MKLPPGFVEVARVRCDSAAIMICDPAWARRALIDHRAGEPSAAGVVVPAAPGREYRVFAREDAVGRVLAVLLELG